MNRTILPVHPYLRHPLTGGLLQAVGFRANGKPIWPVMGGSQPTAEPPAVPPEPTPPPVAPPAPAVPPAPPAVPPAPPVDNGFPAGTPLEQMSPDQQIAYWKHYSRQHEATAKARADYDVQAEKARKFDEMQAANATEQEKAVQAAAAQARAEALKEATPRLVTAEFRAATAGRLTPEQLAAALEPLDMSKFLDATGNVDATKVATHAALLAPAGAPPAPTFPDLGQGQRSGTAAPSVAAGRAMFEAQKKPAPTT